MHTLTDLCPRVVHWNSWWLFLRSRNHNTCCYQLLIHLTKKEGKTAKRFRERGGVDGRGREAGREAYPINAPNVSKLSGTNTPALASI